MLPWVFIHRALVLSAQLANALLPAYAHSLITKPHIVPPSGNQIHSLKCTRLSLFTLSRRSRAFWYDVHCGAVSCATSLI